MLGLSHSGPGMSLNPSCGYFPSSKMRAWNRCTQQLGSLTYGVRAIMVEKVKLKTLEVPLPQKIIKPNQYCVPGGITEISPTLRDLKGARVVIPSIFGSPCLLDLSRRPMSLEK